MIKSFGRLFAGHVDLEHEELDRTPVNEHWLSEAIATLMDRSGYDTSRPCECDSRARHRRRFGAPMLDQDANRELFGGAAEIIFKAFSERAFSHQGEHYTIPPAVPP